MPLHGRHPGRHVPPSRKADVVELSTAIGDVVEAPRPDLYRLPNWTRARQRQAARRFRHRGEHGRCLRRPPAPPRAAPSTTCSAAPLVNGSINEASPIQRRSWTTVSPLTRFQPVARSAPLRYAEPCGPAHHGGLQARRRFAEASRCQRLPMQTSGLRSGSMDLARWSAQVHDGCHPCGIVAGYGTKPRQRR